MYLAVVHALALAACVSAAQSFADRQKSAFALCDESSPASLAACPARGAPLATGLIAAREGEALEFKGHVWTYTCPDASAPHPKMLTVCFWKHDRAMSAVELSAHEEKIVRARSRRARLCSARAWPPMLL